MRHTGGHGAELPLLLLEVGLHVRRDARNGREALEPGHLRSSAHACAAHSGGSWRGHALGEKRGRPFTVRRPLWQHGCINGGHGAPSPGVSGSRRNPSVLRHLHASVGPASLLLVSLTRGSRMAGGRGVCGNDKWQSSPMIRGRRARLPAPHAGRRATVPAVKAERTSICSSSERRGEGGRAHGAREARGARRSRGTDRTRCVGSARLRPSAAHWVPVRAVPGSRAAPGEHGHVLGAAAGLHADAVGRGHQLQSEPFSDRRPNALSRVGELRRMSTTANTAKVASRSA